MKKKISLTGIKPTGMPHWGNYFGAIRPAIDIMKSGEYQCYYFIADYHSLTTIHEAKSYRDNILEVASTWLALADSVGEHSMIIYKQSDIPEVSELYWILSCFTAKGLMNRAHSYKAIVQDNTENKRDTDQGVSIGLYGYPILMASDILIVDADIVPVGTDQLQHIEITRDIANSFNKTYGEVLKLPRTDIRNTILVPGLDGRKMSKSYGNHIPLFLPEKKLRKIIGKIVTDSTPPKVPKNPENSLIFALYKLFATEEETADFESHYKSGISWGEAKEILYHKANETLARPREVYNALMSDPSQIQHILKTGADKAREKTNMVLSKVKKSIGAL